MSCRISSKCGRESSCSTLSRLPVKKLSRHSTLSPRPINRSQRWLPTKPAPPGTRIVRITYSKHEARKTKEAARLSSPKSRSQKHEGSDVSGLGHLDILSSFHSDFVIHSCFGRCPF